MEGRGSVALVDLTPARDGLSCPCDLCEAGKEAAVLERNFMNSLFTHQPPWEVPGKFRSDEGLRWALGQMLKSCQFLEVVVIKLPLKSSCSTQHGRWPLASESCRLWLDQEIALCGTEDSSQNFTQAFRPIAFPSQSKTKTKQNKNKETMSGRDKLWTASLFGK